MPRKTPSGLLPRNCWPLRNQNPGLKSWKVVRWILGDVGTQIFRYYFTPQRIPATLELMDETAAELHIQTD